MSDLAMGRNRLGLALGLLLSLAFVAVGLWFVLHPQPLPTSTREVSASTPVGVPVYVAVYAGSDRTVTVSSVHVNAPESSTAVVAAQVCVGGSLSVTADPSQFCDEIEPVSGARVGPGDVLMLKVQSQTAGTLVLDDVQVSYRDSLQWGTQPVGPKVRVSFLER